MNERLGFFQQLRQLSQGGRAYWLVNLVNFTDGIAYFGILSLLTLYLTRDLGLAESRASIYVSVFTGLVTLFMILGGFLCDRWGTRRAIRSALILGFLGRAALWAAPLILVETRSPFVLLTLCLLGLATGILQPALYAGVKETTRSALAAMGFSLLYSIMNLGIMAESLVSPFLRTDGIVFGNISGLGLGIQGVIGCMALVTLGQLVIHEVFFPRSLRQADEEAPTLESDDPKPKGPGNPLLDPRFLAFIFLLVPVRTLFAHQWLTVPGYVFNCFPEEITHRFEWFNALNPLVVTIAVPIFTHLTGRVAVLKMMIVGTAVSASATFLLSLPPEASRLITYVILFSLGESLWASRFLEYIAQLAPPGRVGSYMGVANLPWFVAKFTTGFYSGWMIERYIPAGGSQDPGTLWTFYGLFACISPIGLLLAYPWLKAPQSSATKEPPSGQPLGLGQLSGGPNESVQARSPETDGTSGET